MTHVNFLSFSILFKQNCLDLWTLDKLFKFSGIIEKQNLADLMTHVNFLSFSILF